MLIYFEIFCVWIISLNLFSIENGSWRQFTIVRWGLRTILCFKWINIICPLSIHFYELNFFVVRFSCAFVGLDKWMVTRTINISFSTNLISLCAESVLKCIYRTNKHREARTVQLEFKSEVATETGSSLTANGLWNVLFITSIAIQMHKWK